MERYLPKGYKLYLENRSGFYTIMEVIGQGSSTVAYLAEYQDLSGHFSKHVIKEFNPNHIELNRDENGVIYYSEKDKDRFDNGLKRFEKGCDRQFEIRNYEWMRNQTPPLEGPYDANNTKYLDVANYVGTTFDRAINEMSIMDRMKICLSITKLIQCYHNSGYLCLDIKPQNIFVFPQTQEILHFIDYDSIFKKEEIVFGNAVSYTEYWSAPEQINPNRWKEISEKSDIYSIGEIIFWSIFDRHSDINEHRLFSTYPFENSKFAVDLTDQARELFTELFHKTLRTSSANRYSSLEELISVLDELIDELKPNKMRIITSPIYPKDFFVGRNAELDEIESLLKDSPVAKPIFISGMGGIGKSEIVKQYLHRHRNKYRNILYWTYSGNLERMICEDESVSIVNLNRIKEETDHDYCERKLNKIKELLKDNNLIIIDNLDTKVEDLEHLNVLKKIMNLPGHCLITTRCNEQDYKQICVRELSDMEQLKVIFRHYYGNEPDPDDYIQKIIISVDKLTLAVELLAKLTKAAFLSPKKTFEKLQTKGIGFSTYKVGLLKDGFSESSSVIKHIEKIYSIAPLTDEQKRVLVQLAFMPAIGIKEKVFTEFFQINNDDLNWLINNGWINCTYKEGNILTVHPVIADVVIESTKENKSLIESIFETEYNKLKNDQINISLSQIEKHLVCRSIAFSGRRYRFVVVLRYIVQYVEAFADAGWLEEKIALLRYAMIVYDLEVNKDIYYPERKRAYFNYVNMLIEVGCFDDHIVTIINEHLPAAQRAKDWGMVAYWYFCLELAYMHRRDFEKLKKHKYVKKASQYYIKYMVSRMFNKNLPMSSAEEPEEPYIKLAELEELMVDWTPYIYKESAIRKLSYAISFRKKVISIEKNDIQITIDEAQMKMWEYQYKDARDILQSIINKKTGVTIAKYKAYELLATVNILLDNYSDAEENLVFCLDLSKQLGYSDNYNYPVKVQLGHLYNLRNRVNESE